ncbi:MAG: prolyl oligopeptidase family serine peptidase [Gemmataceae bacterium]|nr:prolyl oligopeptidase family serine peptidase [Gemmataceae bacterium]
MLSTCILTLFSFASCQTESLGPGRHWRNIDVGNLKRTYLVYVPKKYDPKTPAPLVLALHGATMSARIMEPFSGLSALADREGCIVVYPNGTGPSEILYTWNCGGFSPALAKNKPDDVAFLGKVLDDVEKTFAVDKKRIYAAGMSNGAMMAYRLAAEMSERIAAVAAVAGTLTLDEVKPKRPVPILHFHGTADGLVPFKGASKETAAFWKFCSVEETIAVWVKINGCCKTPEVDKLPMPKDKYPITRKSYNNGKSGSEVVLYVVEDGGHCWPGRPIGGGFLGPYTMNLHANDVIWEFFRRHPMK